MTIINRRHGGLAAPKVLARRPYGTDVWTDRHPDCIRAPPDSFEAEVIEMHFSSSKAQKCVWRHTRWKLERSLDSVVAIRGQEGRERGKKETRKGKEGERRRGRK